MQKVILLMRNSNDSTVSRRGFLGFLHGISAFFLAGIGGLDPRQHASALVGKRNVELAAAAIGQKARELLQSLPPDQLQFNLKAVSPEYWWLV